MLRVEYNVKRLENVVEDRTEPPHENRDIYTEISPNTTTQDRVSWPFTEITNACPYSESKYTHNTGTYFTHENHGL